MEQNDLSFSLSNSVTQSVRGLPEPRLVQLLFTIPLPVWVSGRIRIAIRFRGSGTNLPISAPNYPNAIPKKLQCGQIFHTRVKCNDQVCSLVIDTGSCTNAVSEEAVKKLGLIVDPHPEPYHLAWITNMKLKVDKQCPMTFTIGKVKETVMCDVLPLKLCHILLGRTWIWDRNVEHVGRANTYSFVNGITKYTLTCATDSHTIKLKKTSSLIRRVPSFRWYPWSRA
ncbi:hypothetical protein RHGRI_014064 [Rhododendron griersonianum]|uniref:Uncharacterized protein n=1 Tax=Rhododendron griersonianum TaxID=479676 RepID=A0AAV6K7Z9_9ERIC|nr:hypothetical protein RHGRI_014064 [Rhododendron griersonianum]